MKVVMVIHGHEDGTVSFSSIPDVHQLALAVQKGVLKDDSITYAHRVVNHLQTLKNTLVPSTADQTVVIEYEDTPTGVAVKFTPSMREIYEMNRDNVRPLSRAHYFAVEAKAAIMAMHKALAVGQSPTRLGA